MVEAGAGPHDDNEVRRRILRKATLYTYGFFLAAVILAVAGSALVALMLSAAGLPFVGTWIVLTVLVLAAPLIGALRRRGNGGGAGAGERDAERP